MIFIMVQKTGYVKQNCKWMVGVWEGLNLGFIPYGHMSSQDDPRISIERRCSTILPLSHLVPKI